MPLLRGNSPIGPLLEPWGNTPTLVSIAMGELSVGALIDMRLDLPEGGVGVLGTSRRRRHRRDHGGPLPGC